MLILSCQVEHPKMIGYIACVYSGFAHDRKTQIWVI